MEKYIAVILLYFLSTEVLADVVASEPTGSPALDGLLILGILAIGALVVIRTLRKRRHR